MSHLSLYELSDGRYQRISRCRTREDFAFARSIGRVQIDSKSLQTSSLSHHPSSSLLLQTRHSKEDESAEVRRISLRENFDARRQVKFPFELDASEIASEDLAERIRPVNQAIKEIDKDRRERANVRRRTRIIDEEKRRAEAQPGTAAAAAATASSSSAAMDVDGEAAADEETSLRSKEKERLQGLIDSDLAKDEGCNPTGVYQLVALLTHKGASADGGHYISWVSQEAADGTKADDPEKALWYKFDDDKVSLVTRDTITALAGGGEGSAAFLLLYKAAELA